MTRRFRHALAFLTRLPVGVHPSGDEMSSCVPYFGLVGAVVGGLGAGVFWLGATYASAGVGAALALIVTALVTGGFHEDGLGDTFDALAGGWDVEARLRILKDSRQGTFGVLSIGLVSLLKFSALAALVPTDGAIALVVAHIAARSAAVGLMGVAPVAQAEGLGADYTRQLGPVAAAFGAVPGMVVLGAVYRVDAWLPLVMIVVGVAAMGAWARNKIGGITGDILGAAEQIAEAAVLVAVVVLSAS